MIVVLAIGITTLISHFLRLSATDPSTTATPATEPAVVTPQSKPVEVSAPVEKSATALQPSRAPVRVREAPAPAAAKLTSRRTQPKTVAVDFSGCREIATVHFTANSSELAPEEISRLREGFTRAGELKGKLEISAYCDDIGAAEWNVILSQRRANTVAKAVASIQPDLQLETKGLGSDNPVLPNKSWKARAENRRAEVRVCGGQ